MGAYDKISRISARPLTDYAILYGYDKDNVLILEGKEDEGTIFTVRIPLIHLTGKEVRP